MLLQILLFVVASLLLGASGFVAKKARPVSREIYFHWNRRRATDDDLPAEYARIAGIRLPMVAIYELPFVVVSIALALSGVGVLWFGIVDWYALFVVGYTLKLVSWVITGIVTACMTVSWLREYRRLKRRLHSRDEQMRTDE
jgi:hypothetical protein